jgi:excisionase family DNA binding protein
MASHPRTATADPAPTWPPLLTMRRLLAYSGLGRTTINRAVAAGRLPIYGRPGGGERIFRREDVDRWLASGAGDAPSSPPPPNPRRRAAAERPALTAEERILRAAAGGARDDR